ncbi:hypothetical protein DPMN_085891 [Dreissena polymorpha]|uniref:Uncharacterized protein n=1 Tax=Dreissena polymorpha TaxID=45954 RepID=A0A9D3YFV5_DREPO|nr:hypothetical protein DPMN_085891 [Dreissena polymorpha]
MVQSVYRYIVYSPQILDEAKDGVTCIQVSDHEILSGSADGRIRRYDLRVGKMTVDLIGSKDSKKTYTKYYMRFYTKHNKYSLVLLAHISLLLFL